MRLGILAEGFDRGGAERQAAIWACMGAELGHEITGVMLEGATTAVKLPEMREVAIPKTRSTDMAKIAWRLHALQRELDALVVFEPFLAVCCAAAGLHIPWLAVIGKVPAQLHADSKMPLATYRWALDRATLASAPTEGMIEAYRATRIRPRKEWMLVPNVADADAFVDPRAGQGALFVGRLAAVKDPLLAIDAAAAVPTPLTVLGEGELQAEVEGAIAARGDGPALTLKPFTGRPWEEYASHRALVVSSHYESFGNVIVESLAAGTPVVSVDCDFGPREIIGTASYSHLAERSVRSLAETLGRVLARPYTEAERDECRAIATRYRPEAVAPLVGAALDRLAAPAPSGRS